RQLLAHAARSLSERNARISERTGTPYQPPSLSGDRAALSSQLEDRELDPLRTTLGVREGEPPPYGAASAKSGHRLEGQAKGASVNKPPGATIDGELDRPPSEEQPHVFPPALPEPPDPPVAAVEQLQQDSPRPAVVGAEWPQPA